MYLEYLDILTKKSTVGVDNLWVQPEMVESYINNGSAYLTSIVFLPLGLPADDPFWTDEAQEWTSQKAWNGKEFPRDSSTK